MLCLRGTGALHTEVERASRYLQAVKIPRPTAKETLRAQLRLFRRLPASAVRSVTCDNGPEFTRHYELADTLAIPTYFADPYSAWQRGSNEHYNGKIRSYLPKGTSFGDVTQAGVDEIITEINNRLCAALDWATPAETFQRLCSTPVTTTPRCTSA